MVWNGQRSLDDLILIIESYLLVLCLQHVVVMGCFIDRWCRHNDDNDFKVPSKLNASSSEVDLFHLIICYARKQRMYLSSELKRILDNVHQLA